MSKRILIYFVLVSAFVVPFFVLAQAQDYTLLAPLQGYTKVSGEDPLGQYIPFIFKLAIGLSIAAAVLNIVIGGFQYISSDAMMKKQQGRERIKNAVIALVLILSAWLILNTINPKLLDINLDIKPAEIAPAVGVAGVLPGYSLTPEQIAQETIIRANLPAGVSVNAGPCTGGETSGCTNLSGLPPSVWTGLLSFQSSCTAESGSLCSLRITGGSEGGHISHGPDIPVIDLSKNSTLDSFVTSNGTPRQTSYGLAYDMVVGGRSITFLDESASAPGSTGAHWHVQFN